MKNTNEDTDRIPNIHWQGYISLFEYKGIMKYIIHYEIRITNTNTHKNTNTKSQAHSHKQSYVLAKFTLSTNT